MWEYSHTNELYHAGVKGMKWGVRKSVSRRGGGSSKRGASSQSRQSVAKRGSESANKTLSKNKAKRVALLAGTAAVAAGSVAVAAYLKKRGSADKATYFVQNGADAIRKLPSGRALVPTW